MLTGERWQDSGLVFTKTRGTPLDPRNVLRHFAHVLDAAGIAHVRFHDLRHSCVSLLGAAEVDVAVVSKMVGHSSVTLTLNTYRHIFEKAQRSAASAMDAALGAQAG